MSSYEQKRNFYLVKQTVLYAGIIYAIVEIIQYFNN